MSPTQTAEGEAAVTPMLTTSGEVNGPVTVQGAIPAAEALAQVQEQAVEASKDMLAATPAEAPAPADASAEAPVPETATPASVMPASPGIAPEAAEILMENGNERPGTPEALLPAQETPAEAAPTQGSTPETTAL